MRILDSHFHWWPRAVMDALAKRSEFPRTEPNERGGYKYWFRDPDKPHFSLGPEWNDLDDELAHMEGTRRDFDVLCTTGPSSVFFGDLPPEEARDVCQIWNDEMARAQTKYAGRLWAAALLPIQDTKLAIAELDRAVNQLGLVAVNVPGSIGPDNEFVDAERLEPLYDRVEELGVPLYLHPTDAVFPQIMQGYNGALYSALGRVFDVSASAFRLVLSGIMERHPDLKVFMSHTGGALAYQAGRMDKNASIKSLPEKPSTYLKRMYTDTVSPHALGVAFAIDFYGIDHVMYGDDYPCWHPEGSLDVFEEVSLKLSKADQEKVYSTNARTVFKLQTPAAAERKEVAAGQATR